jgi:cytochrome c-type biogenesis protein CcmH
MSRPPAAALVVVLLLLIGPPGLGAQQPARHVDEPTVYEIAGKLRCVVCQNLSVADSPSEMAQQMRAIIRERLAAGETPEQVVRYFVERYGDWILLEPRRQGFTLLVWVLPPLGLLAGLGVLAVVLHRWSRRGAARRAEAPAVDGAMRERIRDELERG